MASRLRMPENGCMFMQLSLKTRVNLIIAVILTLVVAIGSVLVVHHVRKSVAEETRSALHLAWEMVEASHLQGPLPDEQAAAWRSMLERLGQLRHVRLFILQDERPLPPPPSPALPDVPAWFARLVQPPPAILEQTIPTRQGRGLQVRLVADPADEIAEAWQETRLFLGLILLLAGGCFAALYWVLGRAFQPVDAVLGGLVALEQERYDHRLPQFPQPEWFRIAQAFNHCAGELQQTRADNCRLTRQLLKVEEEERRTLARELHDELGQVLSGIKMLALSIKQQRPAEPTRQAACLIVEQVDHLFETIRAMIHRLRPLMLDDLGLCAALGALADRWRQQRPQVRIQLQCDPGADDFPAGHQIHVYRIVQEALTNAFRHGHPRHVRVRLTVAETPRPRWLHLTIHDDGSGAAIPPLRGRGYGLKGMRERVESLGGRFQVTTAPGRGFTLSIQLPFEEEENDDHPRHACG
ncbi:two-component system, NarL family, sensor histidine kinase UhpB [Methylomarinovum tepidoasis]|uniref:Oxygen sensor histidine kinase NreB n=1 Tax=Methylomarinovum tepidoasis TaxID=2840183 RepID=A0AAU9CYW9_9GAMM|nr:ATP-binding protein [Methylomarinovum sp. IN45]BCX89249.1 two-component system, NarL family, sensor histidine kinase UhpB [Methylomarinovum sp. IN45]